MAKSSIEWTETTWNPVTGCTKVSAGCKNCYAERMAKRLQAMGQKKYKNGFAPTIHPANVDDPLSWKKPQMIFVNSMSDLFHESVPTTFIQSVFQVMRSANWHTFQVLTKRAERLVQMIPMLSWPDNVWVGVSVENQKAANERILPLSRVPAAVRFLSCEPLLGPLNLGLLGTIPHSFGYRLLCEEINWVIVGGESGPGARPMNPDWVRSLRDQCQEAGVPFFFKQWGGVNKKKNGRELDGREWAEMPTVNLTQHARERLRRRVSSANYLLTLRAASVPIQTPPRDANRSTATYTRRVMANHKWNSDKVEFTLEHADLEIYELRQICLNLLGRIKKLEAAEQNLHRTGYTPCAECGETTAEFLCKKCWRELDARP